MQEIQELHTPQNKSQSLTASLHTIYKRFHTPLQCVPPTNAAKSRSFPPQCGPIWPLFRHPFLAEQASWRGCGGQRLTFDPERFGFRSMCLGHTEETEMEMQQMFKIMMNNFQYQHNSDKRSVIKKQTNEETFQMHFAEESYLLLAFDIPLAEVRLVNFQIHAVLLCFCILRLFNQRNPFVLLFFLYVTATLQVPSHVGLDTNHRAHLAPQQPHIPLAVQLPFAGIVRGFHDRRNAPARVDAAKEALNCAHGPVHAGGLLGVPRACKKLPGVALNERRLGAQAADEASSTACDVAPRYALQQQATLGLQCDSAPVVEIQRISTRLRAYLAT